MEMEQIVTMVSAIFGSTTVTTLIGVIVKAIINKVAETKIAKTAKLTEEQISKIGDVAATEVCDAFANGVKIDAEALLDKYTSKRISALEDKQNEIINALNQVTAYAKTTMSAVGDFKTISIQSKEQIATLLKEEEKKIEVVESEKEPVVEKAESKSELSY